MAAFKRSTMTAEDGEAVSSSVTSMSRYSPLLVRPTPKGAAKDMIWWGLKPSL